MTLYVRLPEEGEARLVTDLREITWTDAAEVSITESGRFVPIGDAIDADPRIRAALLDLSPEPREARWRTRRALAVPGPFAWGLYVAHEIDVASALATDAARVTRSADFRALVEDPKTSVDARARQAKIERAVSMRIAYVGLEAALAIAALVIVVAGLRRLRAVPIAASVAAGVWWLFQAGRGERCFGASAWQQLLLATFGLGGAAVTLALAPSESAIARGLRARLGLQATASRRERDRDLVAILAAAWAGVALPFVLQVLGQMRVPDPVRASFFVIFCLAAFLVGLALRRDDNRVVPRLRAIALAACLGFGVTIACNVAAMSSFGTLVEAQSCLSPRSTGMRELQATSARETTGARKESQTRALAFWIAILAAPLAEEMLYRGTLQRIARRRLGARGAIAVSSVIFGTAHCLAFPTAFYQHFGLGLAFAVVFELAGGGAVAVVASAATHAAWNAWLTAMPVS